MIPALANSIWLSACLPEYRRFRRACHRVEQEQASLLQGIISANADTEFGVAYGFPSICLMHSVREFQNRVPLRSYDDYENWITRIASGEEKVLTHEPVRRFVPTGGSTGGSKLIPYTSLLQQQFQRGIQPWTADLFLHHPQLLAGRAYWSVSPVSPASAEKRSTQCGIPIGFDDDTAYVGGFQQRLVNSVMSVPAGVGRAGDMDAVRYLTLLSLVRCRDLSLISVWNPTFLSLLMERLPLWGEEIARDLEKGTISRGRGGTDPGARGYQDSARARHLKEALRCSTPAERHLRLWPRLRLISCWTDANAGAPAAALQALFPHAQIQGKGLLATEGLISFPLSGHDGAAFSVRSHFYEFIPAEQESPGSLPLLAHELAWGRQYQVVITTGGGLYRYRTGDLVEVTGHFRECPLIRFVGRHDHVSDWFGEKLNEAHVGKVLRHVFESHRLSPSFAMLACDTRLAPAYVLYVETEASDSAVEMLAREVEKALCGNFHYRYARQLGQLAPLKIFRAEQAAATYIEYAIAQGQRAGDVKPAALDRRDVWSKVFRGRFVSEYGVRPSPSIDKDVVSTLKRERLA